MVEDLVRDEGLRLKPYKDSVGKLTIGIGRNLEDVGISKQEAEDLLANDIDKAIEDAKTLVGDDFFNALGDVRQRVLVNMAFNLGRSRLRRFRRMLAAIRAGKFSNAADEMVSSRWYQQVGIRAARLELMMRTGED
jgi:lysozyme